MANYRRTQIEVDAFCLGREDFPAWFQDLVDRGVAMISGATLSIGSWVRLKTLDGEKVGFRGEWVVKDDAGEIAFWEHGLFVKTYVPITR